MAMNEYDTGSSIYVTASFTDPRAAGAPVDPSAVTLTVKAPEAADFVAVSEASIANPAVGDYEYVLLLSLEGTYRWKYTGSIGDKVVVIPGSCDSVDRS